MGEHNGLRPILSEAREWSLDQRAEALVTLPIPDIELLAYHWTE
ncbi:hypothetical protein GLA29479_3741 [Lysobacter antibioticus]|nr:hypothetical protein [Lysobacter antibioticus]ALN64592.1 hypothetical protein GLA29479_3741 [Lysobacter antibioticus]